jgi:hypothetical protein
VIFTYLNHPQDFEKQSPPILSKKEGIKEKNKPTLQPKVDISI